MMRKITISHTETYYADSDIPKDKAINDCLDLWKESEPSVDSEELIPPCELGMKCPYSHNCSECK